MRIGLHGFGGRDSGGAPWSTLIAALGRGAKVVVVDAGATCDAIVVCGDSEPAALAPVVAFARAGGAVLGVGEGFQALCALGLLPGRVAVSSGEEEEPAHAHVRVEGRATPFTSAIPAGRVMRLEGARAVGLRYEIGEPDALEARGQVIFRYCDRAGGPLSPTGGQRENGAKSRAAAGGERSRGGGGELGRVTHSSQLRLSSVPLISPGVRARAIAGICAESGNVVGVLAATSAVPAIGAQLLASLRMHLHGKR